MSHFVDLTLKPFGKWLVLYRWGERTPPLWWCICKCGNERVVSGNNLKSGHSTSCGCHRPNATGGSPAGANHPTTIAARARYGVDFLSSHNYWYASAFKIRKRCVDEGIAFGFASPMECAKYLSEIAPTRCPVFGFKLEYGGKGFNRKSPSVDRKIPSRGYTRGNMQIISMLANCMKRDASVAEMRAFACWVLAEGL